MRRHIPISDGAGGSPRLVVLGDLLLDVVVAPSRAIERGTDVPGTVTFRRGGSAANTSAAFVHAGGAASLITSLGADRWTRQLVDSLRDDGVRVHVIRSDDPSGRLAAIVDARGERSFITQRGAADSMRASDVRAAWLRGADLLHVPAYSLFAEPIGTAALEAARLARDAGMLLSSDLSSRGPLVSYGVRRSRARLRALAPDILFANRDEAAALTGQPGMRAWPKLVDVAPLVVVKDGVSGCRVLHRRATAGTLQLDVAAKRIGRVDSTGAGDAFAAGFLHSLLTSGRPASAGGPEPASWTAAALRRAALAGHRAAAAALRRQRPELRLG